ncbi:hypothetical protein M8C21_030623 [Ambrosia artemisiifolia]|uniref:Short-chain dehydrogenase TIC 32, chloroplastic n=1 Tax=Ambrosia artemisiifolia TaxID=4212 RepID=A0AAD5BTS7_AMBAR|nr:hypothetical protein M8C21_030623 [Ambrosia artemisiifolia]
MAVRNREKAIHVKENILQDTPDAKVDVMELDLSSMASVRDFAAKYHSSGFPLNILVNNAGVLSPQFKLSKENIELHFATNHLGHFLLTNLLLETMKTTSFEQKTEGRIINVSSEGHRFAYSGPLSDYTNNESSYNSVYAYGLSKLANILHANELARLLKEDGVNITANSLHPGFIDTELFRGHNIFSVICNKILRYFIKDVSQGASTTCYLALNSQVRGITGEFFSDSNLAKPSMRAKDLELAKELWDFSMCFTSLK